MPFMYETSTILFRFHCFEAEGRENESDTKTRRKQEEDIK